MKKFKANKLLSVVVALTMLVSTLSFTAFASEKKETFEKAPVTAIEQKQAETAENAEKEQSEQEQEWLSLQQSRAQARQSFQSAPLESVGILVNAAEYTITGTVYRPSGSATAKALTVWVSAYTSALDSDNQIIGTSLASGTTPQVQVTIPAGSTSAGYTLRVNSGKYIVCARLMTGVSDILNNWVYYRASGSTDVEYAADVLNVTANQTGKNITLQKADRSISGRITLPSGQTAPSGGVSFDVFAEYYDYTEDGGDFFYASYIIPAGQAYADYTLGVNPRSGYRVEIKSDAYIGGYYAGGTALETWYDSATPLNTVSASITGINAYLKAGKTITVQLNFAAAAAASGSLIFAWYDGSVDPNYAYTKDSRWVNYSAGQTSASVAFVVDQSVYSQMLVSYTDISGLSGYSSDLLNAKYYRTTNGITSKKSEASKIAVASVSTVTITEPPAYTVSGTYDLNGFVPGGSDPIFVAAEFTNGAVYGAYYCPAAGASGGAFALKVPQFEANNSYVLSASRCKAYGQLIGGTTGYSASSTLTGNATGKTVSLAAESGGDLVEISGTYTLPAAADRDGVIINLEFSSYTVPYYNTRTQYYIPKGTSAVNYKLRVPAPYGTIWADLIHAPEAVYRSARINVDGQTTGLNITAQNAVLITGRISRPAGDSASAAVSGSVRFEGNVYESSSVSIPIGVSFADYKLKLPYGAGVGIVGFNQYYDSLNADYLPDAYYVAGGASSYNWDDATDITVGTSNMTNINITLIKAKTLSGSITLPAGAYVNSGIVQVRVEAKFDNTGYTYNTYVDIGPGMTNIPYVIAIPPDLDEDTWIEVRVDNYGNADTNLMVGYSYYYRNGSLTREFDQRSYINVPVSGKTGVNFTLPYAKAVVRGSVTLPEEVSSGYYYFYMKVLCVNSGNVYETSAYVDTSWGLTVPFTVTIPFEETDTAYKFNYVSYSTGFRADLYVNGDGSFAANWDAADTYLFTANKQFHFTPRYTAPVQMTYTPITLPYSGTGTISSGEDALSLNGKAAKGYAFNATAGQEIVITLNSTAFDAYLYLLDSAKNEITHDDDGGFGSNSQITYTIPSDGVYYIQATQYSETGGDFEIRVFEQAPIPQIIYTPITLPYSGTGTISSGEDALSLNGKAAKGYAFNATAGQEIIITLNSTAFDAYLYLLDSAENYITSDDDSGGNRNSRIAYTIPSDGVYYIQATQYSETGGDFEIRVFSPTTVRPIDYVDDVVLNMYNENYNPVDFIGDAASFYMYLYKADTASSLDVDVCVAQYSKEGKLLSMTTIPYNANAGHEYVLVNSLLPAAAEEGAYNVVLVWKNGTMEPVVSRIKGNAWTPAAP